MFLLDLHTSGYILQVSNIRKSLTSPSPSSFPQGDTVKASSSLKKQKRKRIRSLSRNCSLSGQTRSSKKSHWQGSERDTDNQPVVLGTVEKCPNDNLARVSMEASLTETASQSQHHGAN